MITCPNCGKSCPPQLRFCPHCGQRMDVDFEQIKEKLAKERRREEAAEREKRTRKLFAACLFVLLVVMSLLLAVPTPNRRIDPPIFAPEVKTPSTNPRDWMLMDVREWLKPGKGWLSVPQN